MAARPSPKLLPGRRWRRNPRLGEFGGTIEAIVDDASVSLDDVDTDPTRCLTKRPLA
ncbi:MAG: hypothetical protein R2706_21000 [Acidimicrobiales bacterium]